MPDFMFAVGTAGILVVWHDFMFAVGAAGILVVCHARLYVCCRRCWDSGCVSCQTLCLL